MGLRFDGASPNMVSNIWVSHLYKSFLSIIVAFHSNKDYYHGETTTEVLISIFKSISVSSWPLDDKVRKNLNNWQLVSSKSSLLYMLVLQLTLPFAFS